MKISKILATSALAFALVTGADAATTVIHIAGSSAYRAATQNAIGHLLNTGYTTAWADDGGAGINKANAANFTGTLKAAAGSLAANAPVIISVSWTGSAGGVNCVANSQVSTVRGFLPTTATGTGLAASAITDTTSIADIALSDVYKETSGFTGLSSWKEAASSPVGVCPFKWVVSGTNSGITNMTPQLAQSLFSGGQLSKALFTGLASDATAMVTATGRDADSGTRLTAMAETGVGVSVPVAQFVLVNANGDMVYDATGVDMGPAPELTINGVDYAIGNTGYVSGGNLAAAMRLTPSGYTALTYFSKGDAGTATAAGTGQCAELSYNGVSYGSDDSRVQNGSYTFWSYEHLYYRTADSSTGKGGFAEALATQIKGTDASASGVTIASMKVQRFSDGGVVSPK